VVVRPVSAVLRDPLVAHDTEVTLAVVSHSSLEECKNSRRARNDYANSNPSGTRHGPFQPDTTKPAS